MPIPASSCPPGTPPDVCCNTLSLIGDRIRSVGFDALLTCVDTECGDRPFRSYLTFGPRIEDVLGESLIVSMTNATQSPMTNTRLGRAMPMSVTRGTYRLELRENGWPQPADVGGVIKPADSDLINAATFHAMAHGERVWRALVDGASLRNGPGMLFPPATNSHITGVGVGDLTPIGPQAYQAAWSITVTVDAMLGSQGS